MYEEWKPIYTALAADIMDQLGHRDQAMEHTIRPTRDDAWFAGPAVTLDAYARDEPLPDPYGKIFEAYNVVESGDVIVIATNGEHKSGLWGELLATAARVSGVNA
ncbi:MAG: hypothetical protein QGI32_26350, partial [Candidatus Latescibacteria bacterium]|nr:hypothetical protein [Candidatus Latescibacterota bacterium]